MTRITLTLDLQEAVDLLAALETTTEYMYRSPHIMHAKCLSDFHKQLWQQFREQYIRNTNPELYECFLIAEREENKNDHNHLGH